MTMIRTKSRPTLDRKESGFTLVELLTVMALVGVVVTLGFSSFRHYWLARSVDEARGDINAQLRQLQQRAVSESHPLIFGARFVVGSGTWSVVRYDPATTATTDDDTCAQEQTFTFSSGAEVRSAVFAAAPSVITTKCPNNSGSSFVWFYAKGSATGGRIQVGHGSIAKEEAVCVTGLTGRPYERSGGATC